MDSKLTSFSLDLPGFEIYRLEEEGIAKDSYVVSNQAFRDVLYNPHLAGRRLQNRMKKAAVAATKAITKISLEEKGIKKSNLCELVFLSGGLFYELNHGFSMELEVSLPQCFLGISRHKVSGSRGDFEARVGYANFESLPDESTILIGDTLASGATIKKGIMELSKVAQENDKRIERIVFFSLAAPLRGARNFAEACEEISEIHDGLEYHFFGAQQIFHLMDDGTDLRFRGRDAIIPDDELDYSKKTWGEWLCSKMKCAIFDWGTRCKNPMRHWEEFEEFANEALQNCEDSKGIEVLERMLDELKEMREEYAAKI